MIRKDFMAMDDRLWTPEEWAAWLRYVETVSGRRIGCYETAVIREKDSRFVKSDTEA